MSVEIDTKIEWAYGADLTANPATWTWTDESYYALGSVNATWGAQDEGSQTQPTTVSFRLRNTDYRFTPRHPMGAHYPYVRQWTPIRVSQNLGSGFVQRFVVYVDDVKPVWPDGTETVAEVEVTARGVLTRLGAGDNTLESPLRRRAAIDTAPIAYWPLEGGSDSGIAYDVISGLPSTVGGFGGVVGNAGRTKFGAVNIGPGSQPIANIAGGWNLDLSMPASATATGAIYLRFVTYSGTTVRSGTYQKTGIRHNPGFGSRHLAWDVYVHDSGAVQLTVLEADPTFLLAAGPTTLYNAGTENWFDGQPRAWQLTLTASGGTNVAWVLYMNDFTVASGTHTPSFAGAMNAPPFRSPSSSTASADQTAGLGHVSVQTAAPVYGWADPMIAHRGESVTDRLARLCAEESVRLSVTGVSDVAMGPQGMSSLVSQLRECDAADGGILYDGFSAGVDYITADGRSSLAATVALDVDQQQVKLPFEPVENSLRRRNRWTVSRLQGGSATFSDTAAIADDGGVVLPDSASVNVDSDLSLLDQAAWRANLSTVDEMRVPGLTLQLIDRPELWTAWLAMRPGYRLTAVNLPVQYPPGTLDMALEGASEDWDSVSWRVEANTSPYAPWRVAVFAADTGDTGEFVGRFEPDDAALSSGCTATATSLSVKTNSGPLWTTTADDFPFDVGIDGEQIRVTAIAGGASPQTFTVTRSINTIVKTHSADAAVTPWSWPVFGK